MIDIENMDQILQDIYQRLMIDANDVGMAYDEVLQYVDKFEMDEDMLFSFIKQKVKENREKNRGREVMESLKRALRDPLS